MYGIEWQALLEGDAPQKLADYMNALVEGTSARDLSALQRYSRLLRKVLRLHKVVRGACFSQWFAGAVER